jgi:hypothetical protein
MRNECRCHRLAWELLFGRQALPRPTYQNIWPAALFPSFSQRVRSCGGSKAIQRRGPRGQRSSVTSDMRTRSRHCHDDVSSDDRATGFIDDEARSIQPRAARKTVREKPFDTLADFRLFQCSVAIAQPSWRQGRTGPASTATCHA